MAPQLCKAKFVLTQQVSRRISPALVLTMTQLEFWRHFQLSEQVIEKQKNEEEETRPTTHHFPTAVPLSLLLPLSASCAAVAPQEELGVVDGLGDHVALAQET